MPKIVVIVQARMGSVRLPGKVLRPVGGTPLIEVLFRRLALAEKPTQIMLATSSSKRNQPLEEFVHSLGFETFRGDENDVLDRYYHAALQVNADIVVRVTGDCPLIDASVLDRVITHFEEGSFDYVSNTLRPTYPDGLDTEVFRFAALERAWKEATSPYDREHVTPYLKDPARFRVANVENDVDVSAYRWTVDEPEDLAVVDRVFQYFQPRTDFGWLEVLDLYRSAPELFEGNQKYIRNAGAAMGTGQKLWNRAKRVIPGGNSLLSKRVEMFLPEMWPAYFSRTRGCRVWDLDDLEYIDMSYMGIGTNTLGYSHPEVDAAVMKVVKDGNLATLNCPEEVYLAERLIEMHPWAEMARFTRTGGEANAVAVRIARAASGRDKVAVCGYHGWHDWYLSANLGDDNRLSGHLLPGLDPKGVPSSLSHTTLPFLYNRLDQLEVLIRDHEIGVIVMEVMRNFAPADNFLEGVRRLATANGIVLIFDECSSGFRQTYGGLHQQFGVEPDIAMFGKALGNGYAINAIIGRREVMEFAQSSFISSTFWTERIGPTAALKTLEIMQQTRSWEHITATGAEIGRRWEELAARHRLPISTGGLSAMIEMRFPEGKGLHYKTLLTQEMLKRGFLATPTVYVCTEHTQEVLDKYFEALDPVFGLIAECEGGRSVADLLDGPVCHGGFRRLN